MADLLVTAFGPPYRTGATLTLELSGSVTPAGAVALQHNPDGGLPAVNVGGSVTPLGAVVEWGVGFSDASGAMHGTVTPVGALALQKNASLRMVSVGGTVTPVGGLHRDPQFLALGGVVTPAGALSMHSVQTIPISLGGTVTPAGGVRMQVFSPTSAPSLDRRRRRLVGWL